MELNLERELKFRFADGEKTGKLKVHRIVKVESKDHWACYWSLDFVHPEQGRLFGDDPLDALFTCLDFVGNLIRGSEKDGLRVWWQYEGDHCGLMFSEYPETPQEGVPR